MAFLAANAVKYNNLETTDVKVSPILVKNFYKDAIFRDGVTYTSKHDVGPAGQVFARRLGKVTANLKTATAANALDFTHAETADTLIPIVIDQVFDVSEKIYEAVEMARDSATGAAKMQEATLGVAEKFQDKAHVELLAGATADATTAASTSSTLETNWLATRKAIRDIGGKADVGLVSTRIYSLMLQVIMGGKFVPSTAEEILRTGVLGRYLGIPVIEDNHLDDDGLANSTEYVMYDHEAYTILFVLNTARIIDAMADFVGSYAQVQIVAGFKVTTPEVVYKKVITV